MYAIVEDSGTQIIVREGDVLEVDLRGEEQDAIVFDRVLAIKSDDERACSRLVHRTSRALR